MKKSRFKEVNCVYSPKIKKDLIPKIYQLACAKGMPMTKVVDAILRSALESKETKGQEENSQAQQERRFNR